MAHYYVAPITSAAIVPLTWATAARYLLVSFAALTPRSKKVTAMSSPLFLKTEMKPCLTYNNHGFHCLKQNQLFTFDVRLAITFPGHHQKARGP